MHRVISPDARTARQALQSISLPQQSFTKMADMLSAAMR